MIDEDVAVTAAEKLAFDWQNVVSSDSLLHQPPQRFKKAVFV